MIPLNPVGTFSLRSYCPRQTVLVDATRNRCARKGRHSILPKQLKHKVSYCRLITALYLLRTIRNEQNNSALYNDLPCVIPASLLDGWVHFFDCYCSLGEVQVRFPVFTKDHDFGKSPSIILSAILFSLQQFSLMNPPLIGRKRAK